jgi:hypothetical protein
MGSLVGLGSSNTRREGRRGLLLPQTGADEFSTPPSFGAEATDAAFEEPTTGQPEALGIGGDPGELRMERMPMPTASHRLHSRRLGQNQYIGWTFGSGNSSLITSATWIPSLTIRTT